MTEHPLKIYEDLDPKLLDLVNDTQKLALADSALPRWHTVSGTGGNQSRGDQRRNR